MTQQTVAVATLIIQAGKVYVREPSKDAIANVAKLHSKTKYPPIKWTPFQNIEKASTKWETVDACLYY